MKNIFLIFIGVLLAASSVSGIHVIQGVFLDDWSGVHPYNRIYQIPLIVTVGFSLGIFILVILKIFRMKMISKQSDSFKLGIILGLVGVGSLINPWLGYEYTDMIVILIVFVVSLSVAIRFSRKITK